MKRKREEEKKEVIDSKLMDFFNSIDTLKENQIPNFYSKKDVEEPPKKRMKTELIEKKQENKETVTVAPILKKKDQGGMKANVETGPIILPVEKETTTITSKIKKKDGKAKFIRNAGGEVWTDPTLEEWPDNDFRIFVGDLGKEINDDSLAEAFSKYKSLAKAKVIIDKKSSKSKGFGFVSFLDSKDFLDALTQMNGQYIGTRPCKLTKSTWKDRDFFEKKKKGKSFVLKKS